MRHSHKDTNTGILFKRGRKTESDHSSYRGDHNHRRRILDYGELRLLLLAIISDNPSHGYELIKLVEDRFGGSYTPSPGVLYPTLAWLEDIGYTRTEIRDGNRKVHTITQEGEAFLTANRKTIDDLLARGASGTISGRRNAPAAITQAMDSLKSALRMKLRHPDIDEAGVDHIATLIEEAARRIEDEA